MRSVIAAVLLVLLVIACAGEKPAAITKPGAAWTMQDRILDSPSLGFRLTAPAGYEWTNAERRGDDVYAFTATGNNSEVRLIVYDRPYETVTEEDVKKLIDDVKPSFKAAGIDVQTGDIYLTDTPNMGPAYLFGYRVSSGKGDAAVVHGYVMARGRLYQLEKTSNAPWETRDIVAFLKLLKPVE